MPHTKHMTQQKSCASFPLPVVHSWNRKPWRKSPWRMLAWLGPPFDPMDWVWVAAFFWYWLTNYLQIPCWHLMSNGFIMLDEEWDNMSKLRQHIMTCTQYFSLHTHNPRRRRGDSNPRPFGNALVFPGGLAWGPGSPPIWCGVRPRRAAQITLSGAARGRAPHKKGTCSKHLGAHWLQTGILELFC